MKRSLSLILILAVNLCLSVLRSYAVEIAVDEECSLADAIVAANRDIARLNCSAGEGADTIVLSRDVVLKASLPAITSNITIEGGGFTVSGAGKYRILELEVAISR